MLFKGNIYKIFHVFLIQKLGWLQKRYKQNWRLIKINELVIKKCIYKTQAKVVC